MGNPFQIFGHENRVQEAKSKIDQMVTVKFDEMLQIYVSWLVLTQCN